MLESPDILAQPAADSQQPRIDKVYPHLERALQDQKYHHQSAQQSFDLLCEMLLNKQEYMKLAKQHSIRYGVRTCLHPRVRCPRHTQPCCPSCRCACPRFKALGSAGILCHIVQISFDSRISYITLPMDSISALFNLVTSCRQLWLCCPLCEQAADMYMYMSCRRGNGKQGRPD